MMSNLDRYPQTPDSRASYLRRIANNLFPVSEFAERAMNSPDPESSGKTARLLARESKEGLDKALKLIKKWTP